MKGIIQINTKYRKLHSFDNIYCENILKQKSSSDFLKSSRKFSDMSYLTCLSRVFHLCLISPLNCHIILTIKVIVVHHIIIKKKTIVLLRALSGWRYEPPSSTCFDMFHLLSVPDLDEERPKTISIGP